MAEQDTNTEKRKEPSTVSLKLRFELGRHLYRLRLVTDGSWSLERIDGGVVPLTRVTSLEVLSLFWTALQDSGY